jgi:cytoskeleton protein RodZ
MMTLEEMGELLRQERERKGLSVEKAAIEMKISRKYLIALEQGQTSELPHPVYAKGFVKNYARLLGLDPEEMGRVLSNHYAVEDDHPRELPDHGARQEVRSEVVRQDMRDITARFKARKATFASVSRHSGFKPSLWLVAPLALVFAGVAWFFFSSFGQSLSLEGALGLFKARVAAQLPEEPKPAKPSQNQPNGQASQPQRDSAQQPAQSKEEKAESKQEAKPGTGPEPSSAPATTALPESAPSVQRDLLAITPGSGGAKPASTPAEPSGQIITPEKLAAEAQFAVSGKQLVEVNADQPATLEVSTEDGQTRSFTLVKGQRLALRFNDKVMVRFKQAPAVSVKLNGKEYPLDGGNTDGRAVTFQ